MVIVSQIGKQALADHLISLTNSRCSGVELSVSLTGNAGPFDEADGRCRVVDVPFGMLLEVEGALLFLELICIVTLRTCKQTKYAAVMIMTFAPAPLWALLTDM